jgi:hypothetical protein
MARPQVGDEQGSFQIWRAAANTLKRQCRMFEGRKKYQVKISYRFAVLEKLEHDVANSKTCESIRV